MLIDLPQQSEPTRDMAPHRRRAGMPADEAHPWHNIDATAIATQRIRGRLIIHRYREAPVLHLDMERRNEEVGNYRASNN